MKKFIISTGRALKRSLGLVIAFSMILSVFSISAFSLSVSAATSIAGNTIYLDISNNSDWKNKTIVASFDNGVSETATFTGSGNQLTVAVPSGASGADKMTLTAYPSGYPTALAEAAPADKYRIITYDYKSRNYCYAWNSVSNSNNSSWPGQQMTLSGSYYYIDLDAKFENCIFNIGDDRSKSADLSVKWDGNVAYYDSSSFVRAQTAVVNISSLKSTQNLFYVNSDNSVSVSKYQYNGSTIVAETKTVYLYNPNWNAAYVTYDINDAYQVTVAMNALKSDDEVTYFSCEVPVGAVFRFQPSKTSSASGSSSLTVPSDDNILYIMDSSNYWTALSNLPTQSNRIPNTFGDGIYGVTATYFDYMTDNEVTSGYLNRSTGRQDEPFNTYLNSAISAYSSSNSILYPLYFGNLYGKGDGYNGYTNYKNIINNSAGLSSYWYAVQGLASNTLVNNQLYVPSSNSDGAAESPLFNSSWLGGDNSKNKELAKIFNSYFPFVASTDSESGVTTYSFDSSGGAVRDSSGNVSGQDKSQSDNVYFTWDGTTPISVNYGKGSDYAVSDGSNSGTGEFQVDGTGFGIFPFNNTSSTITSNVGGTKTTKTVSASEVICVVDNATSKWGAVYLYVWNNSGNNVWIDPIKTESSNYYFIKSQLDSALSGWTGYKIFGEKNTSSSKQWSSNLTSFAKTYYTDNTTYNDGTYTGSLTVETITGGETYTRTASNETDYGFGIRLDMDFRVPENGLLTKGESYTVPDNEIWVDTDYSAVYCYGYGGTEVALSALSKNSYGFYVIDSTYVGKSTNFILASNDNWGNQYPSQGTNVKISDYTGYVIKYSNSGFTKLRQSGTIGSDPVTFEYSGDDDLWVYISDDEGNSELVLDLGGDHKFTSGSINFNTMQATADFVQTNYNKTTTEKPAVPSSEVWICKDSYSTLYLKTWNKTDSDGNNYDTYIAPYNTVTYTFSDGTTQEFFKYKISDLAGATQFTINTAQTTASELCTLDMSSATVPGNAFRINSRTEGYLAETFTHTNSSSVSYPATSVTSTFFGGQQLDPNKTYHMTVFYMERGLIESNFQVSFTMTPVTNNLLVDKEVEIGDNINNSAIANAVYANDTFGYTSANASETTMSGKTYTYTDQSGNATSLTLGNGGSFSLKDSESAYFVSQFDTGSEMTVTESSVSSLKSNTSLSNRYDTTWVLYDSGSELNRGSSATATFNLEGTDAEKNANLELSYTNQLKTGSLQLKKTVFDKQGKAITVDEDFNYKVLIDVNGGNDYVAYPLNYSVTTGSTATTHYTSDGTISFSPQSVVTIEGLPVGASYKVTETVPEGYTCSKNGITGVIGSTVSVASFSNVQSEGEGYITVNKTLDGSDYTGSQFEFVLQGLASAGDGYVDASNMQYKVNSVTDGEVKFDLKFNEVGKYRFSVKENTISSSLTGYTGDANTYYIELEVGENSTTKVLEINSTSYYSDSAFTSPIESVTFANTTQHAKITVNKTDQNGNWVTGTTFAVIKVTSEGNLSTEQLTSLISANQQNLNKGTTDSEGNVVFDNLAIYQDGSTIYDPLSGTWTDSDNYINGTSTPQRYCVFEYSPATGYNPSYTVQYVTFPYEGKYEITMRYEDGAVIMPAASGDGMNMFLVLGLGIVGTGALLTAGYMIYNNVSRKKRRAKIRRN